MFSSKISFVPRDNGEKSISFDMVDYGLDSILVSCLRNKDNNYVYFKSLYKILPILRTINAAS